MNRAKWLAVNINKPVIEVMHQELERFDSTHSIFKSICPVCKFGVLLVQRDQKTFVLTVYDRCTHCGQRFKYMDVIEGQDWLRYKSKSEMFAEGVYKK
jgi:C4-type Zn-finger protein